MKPKTTKRTSFDLTLENSASLGSYSDRIGQSYGKIVNTLLHLFLPLHPDIKKSLTDFCSAKVEELQQELGGLSEFEKQEHMQKLIQYQELSYFFSDGERIIDTKKPGMRKIYLKEGYLLIPNNADWILLDNYKKPSDCLYAGVVETREPLDGKKKYNARHFVYFTDYKSCRDFPEGAEDEILSACCEKDPSFKDVLNAVVTPIYDGAEIVPNMVNLDEYKAAPCPGLFPIVEKGDPLYWTDLTPDYTPPYGAMIVR